MNRILVAVLLALVICIGLVPVGIHIASRDLPPPEEADLQLESVKISPEENAYTYFLEAGNKLYWPTNACVLIAYLEGKGADEAVVDEIISRNGTVIDPVLRGLACERCVVPDVTRYDVQLPYLSPWRNIGRVMAARARKERMAGRYADAVTTCLGLLRFADMIQVEAGGVIHYLVGVAILDLGLDQALAIARDKGTPESDLRRLSAGLGDLGPFVPGLIRAIKVEYRVASNAVEEVGNKALGLTDVVGMERTGLSSFLRKRRMPRYIFQPNRTRRMFADLYRGMIRSAPDNYSAMAPVDLERELGFSGSKIKWMIRPNAVGRILCSLIAPSIHSILERRCRTECSVAAARLVTACHLYSRTEGGYPPDLQSLVPNWLPAIPLDPYDGQPFRYDTGQRVIYSVGADLKDSGGSDHMPDGAKNESERLGRWKMADAVFEL